MSSEEYVKNFYQGIYITETILGNPNGDFIDNAPRNFDGHVFTTDKCIKYNIRKYIHENKEDFKNKENIVFFFPRLSDNSNEEDVSFKTRDEVFNYLMEYNKDEKEFEKKFNELKIKSPDIRMFGGTFSFQDNDKSNKQIYGPIQLSYGVDINDAQIKRQQIAAPFASSSNSQKTTGSEYVVDDAIITYDITINPNNYPKLLLKKDLDLFKESIWYGTNSRKTTSKKTDSKLLILIKFKTEDGTVFNIGELKNLISINNKKCHLDHEKIEINCKHLFKKLHKYDKFIDSIYAYYDKDEIELIHEEDKNNFKKIKIQDPSSLLNYLNDE